MKVVHLNASSGGGAFAVAQRLCSGLNETGEVEASHLVYTGQPGKYDLWSNNWIRRKISFGLHALEKLDFLRFEKNSSVRFAFSHGKTGIDILNHPLVKQADIIHLHWINKGFISLKSLGKILKSGKAVVWTCHDMWPFTGGCYYSGKCNHYLNGCGNCPMLKTPGDGDLSKRVNIKKAKLFSTSRIEFITPSNWLRNIGLNSKTLGNSGIHTIPNAIDTSVFIPGENQKSEFGLKNHTYTILFAAVNIADKRKGYKDFKLFCKSLISQGFHNFRVLYIGENKGEIISEEDYEQRFTGYISDQQEMAQLYGSADLYVTTSSDDNLPTTIMESMACGTPVAAFSAGGIPEMIDDEQTGVIAEVHHPEALAEKVISLFEGRFGNRGEVAEKCRDFVLKHYSMEVVTKAHIAFYKRVLTEQAARN